MWHFFLELLRNLFEELIKHVDSDSGVHSKLIILATAHHKLHLLSKFNIPRQLRAHKLKSKEHQRLNVVLVSRLLALQASKARKHKVAHMRTVCFIGFLYFELWNYPKVNQRKLVFANVWFELFTFFLYKLLFWNLVLPWSHANVIRLYVTMNKAAPMQVREWLDQLAKHVEHYTSFLIGTHLDVNILTHELLNRVTAWLHFYLGHLVCIHEAKNSRDSFNLWEKVVFAD